jgi:hypothetical protein
VLEVLGKVCAEFKADAASPAYIAEEYKLKVLLFLLLCFLYMYVRKLVVLPLYGGNMLILCLWMNVYIMYACVYYICGCMYTLSVWMHINTAHV